MQFMFTCNGKWAQYNRRLVIFGKYFHKIYAYSSLTKLFSKKYRLGTCTKKQSVR